MTHTVHDIGAASQIGLYSDSIETKPNLWWLMTFGNTGIYRRQSGSRRHHEAKRVSLGERASGFVKGRHDGP
jgi:hypothetical protein